METYYIGTERLTLDKLEEIIESGCEIALSEEAIKNIEHCRNYLDEKMKNREILRYRKMNLSSFRKTLLNLTPAVWVKKLNSALSA